MFRVKDLGVNDVLGWFLGEKYKNVHGFFLCIACCFGRYTDNDCIVGVLRLICRWGV